MSDEKPKTADDIVSELREKYASHYYCEDSTRRDGEYPEGFDVIETRKLADSIEEAVKRDRAEIEAQALSIGGIVEASRHKPVGNAAAMREALVAVKKSIDGMGISSLDCDPTILMAALTQVCARLSARIERALSAPARNCDVGTAEEQTKRFSDFCAAHRHTDLPRCAGCPLENIPSDTGCSFAWAQTPYEAQEGGKGDGV